MFKLSLLMQLCLASLALAAPSASPASKGVKRDVVGPGSIANLYARDDDIYYNQYPGGYAGGYGYSGGYGYGYYPRATDVISPLYYNDGYSTGWGYGTAGLGSAYPYYYSGTGGVGYPGYYGYNRYNRYGGYGGTGYGGYGGYGLGYGGYGLGYY